MAKKKDKPQVINNIQELNLEIDYDKLAETIVRANFLQQEEIKKQEEEKRKSNRMQALKKIGRASCGKECVCQCRSRWSPYH